MVGSKLNFTDPSYALFVHNVVGSARQYWKELDSEHKTLSGWWSLVLEHGSVTWMEIFSVFVCAILWTISRNLATQFVLKPIVDKSGLPQVEARKAPESAWKFVVYSCLWAYSIHILFFTEHDFFFDVPSTFTGWKSHSFVPRKIYIAYLMQISFYLHSVYATLFIDVWRKDSVIMMLHHMVTLLLTIFSYAFRYTNVGILVLFLHDITDIILEATKLLVYYKKKGGLWHTVCDVLSSVGFILFGLAWYVFRLYWYPLKAMYAAGYISRKVSTELVFYHFFNTLLWMLLAMNIYWFTFIVLMAYKILTKQLSEVDDTREYKEDSVLHNNKKRN